MAPVSKSLYIDKSGGIVRWIQLDEYKHTYQSINKPADLKSSTYIDLGKENNEKKPKFDGGDKTRISKYKKIFAKGYVSEWSEEVFAITDVKSTVPWTYAVSDLNGEEIVGRFFE